MVRESGFVATHIVFQVKALTELSKKLETFDVMRALYTRSDVSSYS